MVNIRNKGQRGEREVINIFIGCMQIIENELRQQGYLCPQLSDNIQRNALQADKGGHDVFGLPYISVEVKRQENLHINQWWEQCVKQAQDAQLMPVLIYRKSRQEWHVISYVKLSNGVEQYDTWVRAEYSMGDFIKWYSAIYRDYLISLTSTVAEPIVRKVKRRDH